MKKTPQKKITPGLIAKDENGEKRSPSDIAKRSLRIIGTVVGFRKTSKQFGDRLSESTGFKGMFEAEERDGTGNVVAVHSAGELFLPSFLDNELVSAFKAASLNSEALTSSVDIAVSISARIRKDLAVGYEWTAENLLPPQIDPLEHLRNKLTALPGPSENA